MSIFSIRVRPWAVSLIVLLPCWCAVAPALGTTYDRSPRATMFLKDAGRFIAQDAWNSVAMYRVSDAMVIHGFPASRGVNKVAISPDEKLLLLACDDGSLSLWEIETGKQVWQQSPSQSGLGYVYDASFAHNGESCIVCDQRDQALVFETRTGRRLGVIRFPPMQTNIMSAALSPDGTSGMLIDLGERLFSFDVATGRLTDTGLMGAWPIRYSVDGKYVACRSNNSGTSEQLRVIAVHDKFARRDYGQFSHIGHVKPADDGSFLVSGWAGGRFEEASSVVGMQIWPKAGRLQEVWKHPPGLSANERTDFLPQSMTGVSTDYRLVTQLTDLHTGASLRMIDNSANYRPILVSSTSNDAVPLPLEWLDLRGGSIWIVLAAILAVTGLLAILIRRRRRVS